MSHNGVGAALEKISVFAAQKERFTSLSNSRPRKQTTIDGVFFSKNNIFF
jgi:hypothetical protein